MPTTKVLVCGATGFIGKNILLHYAKKKNIILYATHFKSKKFLLNGVKWINVDLRDELKVKKITKGIDIIIQAAATTSGSNDIVNRPYLHVTDNAIMNSILLRSCYENKVKHFIFFSCTTMYPSSKKGLKENEFSYENIIDKYFGVANTKLYIEKMCEFYSKLEITKHTVIRHSNIYGPHDKYDLNKSHFFGATITKVMSAEKEIYVWGRGTEKRDLLYISDLINFVDIAIKNQINTFGLYNCGLGKAHSVNDIVGKIIKFSKKKLLIKHDITKPNIDINILVNISKAKKELHWKPMVSIDLGIKKTISWYKKNFYNK